MKENQFLVLFTYKKDIVPKFYALESNRYLLRIEQARQLADTLCLTYTERDFYVVEITTVTRAEPPTQPKLIAVTKPF